MTEATTPESSTTEVIYTSAKGLNVVDKGGLPFEVHVAEPDRNNYFTLEKDGVTFGSLFMDVRKDSNESYGLTDAMLIAVVKHRYGVMAQSMPELQKLVDQLGEVLETVDMVEKTLTHWQEQFADTAAVENDTPAAP